MVLFDKACIKFLKCDTSTCVRNNRSFSSTFNENDNNRETLFKKKLPQINVNEFYNRHIFEQDEPISPVAHDDQNTDANDEFITVLKQVCFVVRKCLEECGKNRFATLEQMFNNEKEKIKSTTKTPSE